MGLNSSKKHSSLEYYDIKKMYVIQKSKKLKTDIYK